MKKEDVFGAATGVVIRDGATFLQNYSEGTVWEIHAEVTRLKDEKYPCIFIFRNGELLQDEDGLLTPDDFFNICDYLDRAGLAGGAEYGSSAVLVQLEQLLEKHPQIPDGAPIDAALEMFADLRRDIQKVIEDFTINFSRK